MSEIKFILILSKRRKIVIEMKCIHVLHFCYFVLFNLCVFNLHAKSEACSIYHCESCTFFPLMKTFRKLACHSCQLSRKIRETPGFQDDLPNNMKISLFFKFRKIFLKFQWKFCIAVTYHSKNASYFNSTF